MIRTLICDDEKPARLRLSNLIKKDDQLQIIGEAKNGSEALQLIETLKPDIVFLDIQMPDFSGIEVAQKIQAKPYIIFVTAYDSYAIKAFEINSLDYILKPYTNERFNESLSRAKKSISESAELEFSRKLSNLLTDYNSLQSTYVEKLSIKGNGQLKTVFVNDIFYIHSYSNYLKIHTSDSDFFYRTSLEKLEQEFNPEKFLRIHRSYIINTTFIKSYKYLTNNEYEFLLTNGVSIKSGRSYSKQISTFFF